VPSVAPAAKVRRLGRIIEGTPVQVGPLIPAALAVGTRKKRMAITSEDPPAKALRPVAEALRSVADFVKGYEA
jgi:chromosome partitioning protein